MENYLNNIKISASIIYNDLKVGQFCYQNRSHIYLISQEATVFLSPF